MDLSLVIPVYNEADNLIPLALEIHDAMAQERWSYEVLLVDDGSTDDSRAIITKLCEGDPHLRGIFLDRNHGQTAAFLAGFARAAGEVIVTLDADLQNDPRDVPRLLEKLPGRDMVIGVRQKRHDTLLRRVSSRIANRVRSWATRDGVTDIGCSLKAFRRDVALAIPPYRGMHRFFPTLALMDGRTIAEVPVSHRHRRAGKSKYGLNRLLPSLHDLFAVRWMRARKLRHRVVGETSAPASPERVDEARTHAS
ncbi:MAG: glycosyltransferase family 2 protein [Acidobacteriota bacterium]